MSAKRKLKGNANPNTVRQMNKKKKKKKARAKKSKGFVAKAKDWTNNVITMVVSERFAKATSWGAITTGGLLTLVGAALGNPFIAGLGLALVGVGGTGLAGNQTRRWIQGKTSTVLA